MMHQNRPEAYETTTELAIDDKRYAEISSAFMAHMQEDGAHFLKPNRLDLLHKP
jgi:hypothetical protein